MIYLLSTDSLLEDIGNLVINRFYMMFIFLISGAVATHVQSIAMYIAN